MRWPEKIFLANLPTPIHGMERTSEALGVEAFVKRDDMTGGVETGNKIRKLEYVMADALRGGYDTIVTCGGADSNHARATAIACARCGIASVLILRKPTTSLVANLVFDRLLGADVRLYEHERYHAELEEIRRGVMEGLEREGRKPYWVPTGASMPMGAVGYVECVKEIADFERESGISFDRIVFASGSGGTEAGLLVGVNGLGIDAEVLGINTGEDEDKLRSVILSSAEGCAELMGLEASFEPGDVAIVGGYDAGGYGIVDDDVVRTIRRFAREESLILDPVYTAKAAMGLVGECERGRIEKGEKVLFIHTGGVFGLFAHHHLLTEGS
jgi:D-cysteine desulfhydrase